MDIGFEMEEIICHVPIDMYLDQHSIFFLIADFIHVLSYNSAGKKSFLSASFHSND